MPSDCADTTGYDNTIQVLKSGLRPRKVYELLKSDDEYDSPIDLFYNGENYFCPDDRCRLKSSDSQDVERHIDETHDSTLRKHFISYYGELVVVRENWIRHEELLEEYREESDQEVMEGSEFIQRFEHGVAVCALCGETCGTAKEIKAHKKESGHNIWFRRLKMPDGYVDPKAK